MRRIFGALSLLAALLLILPVASAQSIFATLNGSVRDGSGAVVSGATVAVRNSASGETRKTVTNADGFFTVSTLPAGTYQVTVEMKGFKKWQGSGIMLNGSDSRTMNIELNIGAVSETVEVNAIANDVATIDSGEKSALISSKDLQDLSLVGRNSAEYLKLLPGSIMSANLGVNRAAYTGEVVGINGFAVGSNAGGLSGVNINGQGVDITQDGQHTYDPGSAGNATPVNANPNMISEVKVLTSNFSSENPKGPVVVNTVTKSGGSTFHGEAYIYARNTALNAEDAFNKSIEADPTSGFSPGSLKGQSAYYYPGFNIGGPVLIPGTGLNKSRKKLFFFEGYENYHQTLDGGVNRAFVPTADMLNGDFSALNTYGGSVGRFGMGTVPTAPAAGSRLGFDARAAQGCTITGGVLAPACIDPNGLLLMKNYLPAPTISTPNGQGFNYIQALSVPQNSWQNVVRGDWNISDNTKVYVSWSRQRETANMPLGLWTNSGDWVVPAPSNVVGANGSDFVGASFVHVFSPTMTSETRFGYTYINFPSSPTDPSKILRKEAGFPLTGIYNNPDTPAMISWGQSVPNLGEIGHDFHPTMIAYKGNPSVAENLTKVIKTHTTKYGFYYEHVYNKQDNWGQFMGALTYDPWNSVSGNNYADMLMGIGSDGYFEQALPPPTNLAQNIAAFYAQDSWKVTRRITVDYGMRFEHYAKPYANNSFGIAIFDPAKYNPASTPDDNTGVLWHSLDHSVPLSGAKSRMFFFSPRVGAAIDLFGTGRTILRGGWGKYRAYDSIQSNTYTGPAQTAQGSVGWSCGFNDPLCPTWEDIDTHGVVNCTVPPCAGQPVYGKGLGPGLKAISVMNPRDDEQPLVTSYSLTVDQQLPAKFRMELSYVGNHSEFLQGTVNLNAIPLGSLSSTCTASGCQQPFRPFQNYQNITGSVTAGKQQFDSLQASLQRNVGFLSMQANYTWSKALGDAWNLNNGTLTGTLPDYGAHYLWGVSPIDRAQALSLAYVFNLPRMDGHAFLRNVVGGWQISGITQIESGAQLTNQSGSGGLNFNLTQAGNNISLLGTPDITLYPLITCNPTGGLKKDQFLNPNCFGPAPLGALGTGSAPYMPGPRFWNSDLTVSKNFKITERQAVQFRFAAFNFLNHSLLSFTNGDNNLKLNFDATGKLTTPDFGVAKYRFGHRIFEMGVKYSF
jgi:hypothetical protein